MEEEPKMPKKAGRKPKRRHGSNKNQQVDDKLPKKRQQRMRKSLNQRKGGESGSPSFPSSVDDPTSN